MRIILLFFSLFLFSCSKKKPVLSHDDLQFASVLVDIYISNGLANQLKNGNKDSLRNSLYTEILKNNDLDSISFNKKLKKLEQNPEKFKMMYDTVVKRLELFRGNK
ncbi:MAG: DUF4296 domain-containing protein [Saprospiraceae bacterium]|nr:DUF4296 domain-containing protein [Saprospiraceae bacterium]